ncbi:hypothetical protein FZC83_01920 [Rossellomorea marisflavi]|uniref:Uncharacterized protein n=1 Tax=Rossellomorea marisflavi TaxID=189381 RepID=A0A5D4S3B3_9BACI|nr:hypothetical protein [Rossellomorea marisflavi]TYS56352.1 hypothetical protein FZC83_01920 [Rossellomorea marisflavi]
MTNQNTLREAENKVEIEGLLLEVRHQEWKSKEGLNIELDIEVGENEIHTVHGMSKYKKKDGSDNGIAKGYLTVIDEYKSVADVGREDADKVRVSQGKIELNEYFGQDGMLKSFPQIRSNFFNRLAPTDEYAPKAEFDVEMVVAKISEEKNKDQEETGRVKLKGFIPLFGGTVIPFEFVVSEEGSEYVEQNYEKGETVNVFGKIINFKESKTVKKAAAFGADKEVTTYNTVREYLITGGGEPYEEDNKKAYDPELIGKALTEREVYLEELKKRNTQSSGTSEEKKKSAFGGGSTKKKEKSKISSDELPF